MYEKMSDAELLVKIGVAIRPTEFWYISDSCEARCVRLTTSRTPNATTPASPLAA